jgi:hypothetical protein
LGVEECGTHMDRREAPLQRRFPEVAPERVRCGARGRRLRFCDGARQACRIHADGRRKFSHRLGPLHRAAVYDIEKVLE